MKIGEPGFEIYTLRAGEQPRRVEKPKPSSQLADHDRETKRLHTVSAAPLSNSEVSHSETQLRARSPNFGPSCGFMAQIIGQILTAKAADAGHAARTYDAAHAQMRAASPHFVASL